MGEWLERELEDYIVEHPEAISAAMFPHGMFAVSILGRQVRCQYGIIDVLMWAYNSQFSYVIVVECKANHEKGLAVEQVERYRVSVESADIYSDTPDDAWPVHGTDEHGWSRFIELKTFGVIVAPSFSDKITNTYNGTLIQAQKTINGFNLERVSNREWPNNQTQLDIALAPAIKRAQIDAKIQHLQNRMKGPRDIKMWIWHN